jgi:hypothetical protein
MEHSTFKGGYFTIHMDIEGRKIPYVIFASSDYQAARKLRQETGYVAVADEIEGPYQPF